uniref:Uncharacterized protein n=1 Tax=Parascaris univalens TaxID=6257 RepID=A0A915CJT7_PARUN
GLEWRALMASTHRVMISGTNVKLLIYKLQAAEKTLKEQGLTKWPPPCPLTLKMDLPFFSPRRTKFVKRGKLCSENRSRCIFPETLQCSDIAHDPILWLNVRYLR